MNKISSHDFCRTYLRTENYHHYLMHFFATRDQRALMLGLLSLHQEIITIQQKTNDPSMAAIRMKWWYDEIEHILNDKPHSHSPCLDLLSQYKKDIAKIDWDAYFTPDDIDISLLCTPITNADKWLTLYGKTVTLNPQSPLFPARLWLSSKLT